MSSRLQSLPGGLTQVTAEMHVDLTGRLMQVGRGMIQGVSRQLIQQFVARTKQRLEAPAGAPAPAANAPIRVVPLLLRTLWSAVSGFFRRLLGRSEA